MRHLQITYMRDSFIFSLSNLTITSALRSLALRGLEHVVFAEGALQGPRQFKNVWNLFIVYIKGYTYVYSPPIKFLTNTLVFIFRSISTIIQ